MPVAQAPDGFTSRPYRTGDAEAAAALQSLVFAISPSSLDQQLRLPGLALNLVVEHCGAAVALLAVRVATVERAGCRLLVRPEVRGRGLGTFLLGRASDFVLATSAARTLRTAVRDDDAASLEWGFRHGFVEVSRSLSLVRELPESVDELSAAAAEAAATAGVTLKPWARSPDDGDWAALTELLMLANEGDPDSGSGHVDESVTRYLVPNPQGVLLAEREGAAIGLTSIAPVGGGVWYSWFTGVVPQMRGRGVGRALKLSALAHARSQGASRVATNNDAVNTPVLRLNELLGYERRPGSRWLHAQIAVAGDGFTTG